MVEKPATRLFKSVSSPIQRKISRNTISPLETMVCGKMM